LVTAEAPTRLLKIHRFLVFPCRRTLFDVKPPDLIRAANYLARDPALVHLPLGTGFFPGTFLTTFETWG
jgi:hypothetical protein